MPSFLVRDERPAAQSAPRERHVHDVMVTEEDGSPIRPSPPERPHPARSLGPGPRSRRSASSASGPRTRRTSSRPCRASGWRAGT
ncbi:MAG TPA: hypothetical protein DEF51_36650 [Myxococcales bacterium]|nr:hypothetical protein [Myxococcales bacterium]